MERGCWVLRNNTISHTEYSKEPHILYRYEVVSEYKFEYDSTQKLVYSTYKVFSEWE